jgi:hypothetical protein
MDQQFDPARNVYVDRDQHGAVRALQHVDAPFASAARTPQLVAADYLSQYGDLLQLDASRLGHLGDSPTTRPITADVELRYLGEKSQFDTATVAYHQTVLGLPVWEAGVAVQMRTAPFRVLSAQSTQHDDIKVSAPGEDALKRAESLSRGELSRVLGVREGSPERKSLEIEGRSLVVYRYDADKVQRDGPASAPPPQVPAARGGNGKAAQGISVDFAADQHSQPWLPLPPVPDSIVDGEHYVCAKVDFAMSMPEWGSLHWTAMVEVDTLAVVYLRPYVDDVSGLVFDIDPITTNGGPAPSATSSALNPIRVSQSLLGLAAPANGTQSLSGDTVTLADVESPTDAAPTEPSGTNFDFDARTDDFSAVNAYVHCDRFFRLVDSMGFARSAYFPGTTFPTQVDHRGSINASTGIEVNAHCVGTSAGTGIGRTTFALADVGDPSHPIGIADDFRVVLHELGGHGILYNHVSSPNFRFAHSAGDSVAAITADPGSQAPDRFVTFPWVNIGRRHDRAPSGGWGWAGSIALNPFGTGDSGGYNNEQILSSTMFRIYRSLGGDSADINTQRFAARMTVYLILRAVATLTPATNPTTGAAFEAALETADAGDWISENITGGAYRKVIRWAFEKQGAFQPSGASTPNNNVGAPPAVDVYIEDGRAGEYQFQPVFWDNHSIWNRLAADGGTAHQDPVTNRTNYAYVKVKNRGTQTATNVVVKAYHANPAAGLSYPNDWIPMTTTQLSASNIPANNASEIMVGPFAWTPTHVGHECMFMIVSATGDSSNVDNIAAGDSIPEWRLVPHDNNIGQRNVAPVPGGGTSGLTEEFAGLSFEVKNPMTKPAVMVLEPTLPALLTERKWRLDFVNRGGGAFTLQPGESREAIMRLTPGADFTAADVAAAGDPVIRVAARADGILVGGMTYQVDHTIERPNRPGHNPAPGEPGHQHDDTCGCRTDRRLDAMAETLIHALQRREQRVREVEIRKIVLEVELEDCDDD